MAPTISIKIPSSTADTGSDCILIRKTDAVAATLTIYDTSQPLRVRFPDGQIASSIGTSEVALPSTGIALPAHVFADDSLQQSLFGISDITNNNYAATFRKDGLYLYHDDELVHYSPKSPTASSWTLPIQRPLAQANAIMSLPSDKKYVQFMFASFGSPAHSTLLRALRKGYLSTLARFTSTLFSKHKPNTVATAMGHLDRRRQGLDSTSPVPVIAPSPVAVPLPPASSDIPPPGSSPYDAYTDMLNAIDDDEMLGMDLTVYTRLYTTADFDATGRFPVTSSGSKYAYQLVSCFNGSIHVEPMTSRTSTSYIAAHDKTFLHWSRYGHVPSFVRLDAETSTDLEKFLQDEKKVTFQYFPTGTHRANRAERCIRTWKNHFISTLATASPKFPMSYWNKLIPLAELTLNCLLPWQPNPAISAYHGLTGAPFDFRAHPIAPAGTSILIHEAPETRGTWAGHGVPGYYLGPALTHYRSHHVFVTATSAPRVTDTVAWFPETEVTPPPPNATEMLIAAIKDFSRAIKQFNLTGNFIPPTLVQDLEALASLHTGSAGSCLSPTNDVTSPSLVPTSRTETRVAHPAAHNQEIRVAETPQSLQGPRVATPDQAVQELRVVLPTLAIANPAHTAPCLLYTSPSPRDRQKSRMPSSA